MRLHSTVDSFGKGEITWLAIIETLLATGVGFAVVIVFETYLHLLIGAGLAPLLLLRTERSVKAGIKGLKWNGEAFNNLTDPEGRSLFVNAILLIFVSMSFPFILPLFAFFSRLYGIITTIFSQSIVITVNAIPQNWKLQVLCLDFFHPPELVPGIERAEDFELATFRMALSAFRKTKPWYIPLLLFWYLPAWIYRWSLKSTAWAYSPLLFVILRTFDTSLSVGQRLKDIHISEIARFIRVFSLIFIALFIAKLLAFQVWADWSKVLEGWGFQPFFFLIEPTIVPKWQVVFSVNALLGWVLFFFAGRQLEIIKLTENPPAGWVDPVLRSFTFVRTSLAVGYIIPIMLFLVARQVFLKLPPIDEKWFPWDWAALWSLFGS